jgi:tRNA threonylcarbamoyladenosine biosynthesis protein TsaE
MEALGAKLAASTPCKALVFLQGELGAGKTTLVRGFLRSLGVRGAVKSPTYTLVEPYELASHDIYHIDLYRLVDAEELELIGMRDYLSAGVVLVEWPSRASGHLPNPDLTIEISVSASRRSLTLCPASSIGEGMLESIVKSPL